MTPSTGRSVLQSFGQKLVSEATKSEPAVVCSSCNTPYTGDEVTLIECPNCNANLIRTGMYLGGACPYAEHCPVPYGKCHCGCGDTTGKYRYTHAYDRVFQGAHMKYKPGHNQNPPLAGLKLFRSTRKPTATFMSKVEQARTFLRNNPNTKFGRGELAVKLGMSPKQAGQAMYMVKNEPGFGSDRGTYWYGDVAADTKPSTSASNGAHRTEKPGWRSTDGYTPSENAMVLYEAFAEIANANGVVTASSMDALVETKLLNQFPVPVKQSPEWAAKKALTELHDYGFVDASHNRTKRLLRNPRTGIPFPGVRAASPAIIHARVEDQAAVNLENLPGWNSPMVRPSGNEPVKVDVQQPDSIMDAISHVDDTDLANSIARIMWERYEWALSEIGRLQEIVAVQREQLARCEELLAEQAPPTISTIARRFLADSSRE